MSTSKRALREISSVTFDVKDGLNEGNVVTQLSEACSCSGSPDTVVDARDQQRAPKSNLAETGTQTIIGGGKDDCAERDNLSPDGTGNSAADKTDVSTEADADCVEEAERKTGANTLERTERMPDGSEVAVPLEQEEPPTATKIEPEPVDPSERPASAGTSALEVTTGQEMCQTETKEDVCEPDGREDDADAGGRTKTPHSDELQTASGEGEEGRGQRLGEEETQEQSCAAEAGVESGRTLHRQKQDHFSRQKAHQTPKQES